MGRAAATFVAFALLAALPVSAKDLPPGGLFGGELRVALLSAPDLNPVQFPSNRLVQGVAYEALVRLGPEQTAVGSLASGWTADPGAGTIAFDLRAANWSDGTPIDAQDVTWSFQKHVANGLTSGFTVTAVDADTVRFTFSSGGGRFLETAATLPIAWKDGSNTATLSGPYAFPSSGTGALNLTANGDHWAGRPYFDRLAFLFPYTLAKDPDGNTSEDDAGCALMLHQVDVIGWPVTTSDLNAERDCVAGFGGLPDGQNHTLGDPARPIPHVGSVETAGLRFLFLGLNTARPPLGDPILRQGLSRAVDRDLVAGTYGNAIEAHTDIADSPVSPANEAWFNASVPKYRVPRIGSGSTSVTSLEAVNEFLDAAGYFDVDGDGWRDDKAGLPFSFILHTLDLANDPATSKYLDLLTKFQAIGINVVQQEHAPADLRATVASDAFDLYVDIADVRGEPSFLYDMFHSAGTANDVNLNSPELDAILETARDAIDPAVRRQAVFDAQGWIAVNAPLAPIVHFRSVNVLDREAFEGWAPALGGVLNYESLTGAFVTQRGPLSVTIDALDKSLRSRESTAIVVTVRDTAGDPVPSVSLWLGDPGIAVAAGLTDASGQFRTAYTAPAEASDPEVILTAEAAKAGYVGATASTTVTVHASPREFTISLAKGATTMESRNETFVRVVVRDRGDASAVAGAAVSFSVFPADLGGTIDLPNGTTNTSGAYEARFRGDTLSLTRFLISATVSAAGYADATVTTSIEVLPRAGAGAPRTPALDTISMVALVATLAALYGAWQRRKWVSRKP